MRKMKIAVIAAIAVLGLGALGGVAVRANADTSPAPDPATTLSAPAEAPEDANTPDTDNVQLQEGDQSSPDGAAADEADADGPVVPTTSRVIRSRTVSPTLVLPTSSDTRLRVTRGANHA